MLREAPCLTVDAGHPLSPAPSQDSQKFVVFYAAVFQVLMAMVKTRQGASIVVQEHVLQELTHFGTLLTVRQNLENVEGRLRFSMLLDPVLKFVAALLTCLVGPSPTQHRQDLPMLGRLVLRLLDGMKSTIINILKAPYSEKDRTDASRDPRKGEQLDVILEEVQLLTHIACQLAATGVLNGQHASADGDSMHLPIMKGMLDLHLDMQRVSHAKSKAHADTLPSTVVGVLLDQMSIAPQVGFPMSSDALVAFDPAQQLQHEKILASEKQRLLPFRIAANLCRFQLTLMELPGSDYYTLGKLVLQPCFQMKDGRGQLEISHANELLLFAEWCAPMFKNFRQGLFNQGHGEAELRQQLQQIGEAASTERRDIYALQMHGWAAELVLLQQQLSALGYCIETSMVLAMRLYQECSHRHNDPEIQPVNENDRVRQRANRLVEAERYIADIKRELGSDSLDNEFILNTEKKLTDYIATMRKYWIGNAAQAAMINDSRGMAYPALPQPPY